MTTILLRGISERDIDLLLVEELVATADFRAWFGAQAGIAPSAQVETVARSVNTSTGESDLEVTFRDTESLTRVLVENKIDAILQPRQPERYAERAASYIATGVCKGVVTLLVAPERYTGGASGFDRRLTYETLREWFSNQGEADARSQYKVHLLDAAIERGSTGWLLVPDEAATAFWQQYWEVAAATAPELRMPKPGVKPATSGFIRFLPPVLPAGVNLIHKVPLGKVDLQFAGMAEQLAAFKTKHQRHLEPDMRIARAQKSMVIRIHVPPASPQGSLEDAEPAAIEGINAAVRLLSWYSRFLGDAG